MLLVLALLFLFAFLFAGAVVFLLALPVPATRRYALSAALWSALWGPCLLALIIFSDIAAITGSYAASPGHSVAFRDLPQILGLTFTIVGLLGTAALATALATLHQFLINRLTFPLFRIYATLVAAGIGSVFGWAFGLWLDNSHPGHFFLWVLFMLALIALFATLAYRFAPTLRGPAPTRCTWITPSEFNPPTEPSA